MAEFLLVLGIEDLEQVRVLNGARRDSGAAFGQAQLRIGNSRWISPFIRLGGAKPSLRVNCKVYRLIERVH